jgi:hypothetical protein
VYGAVTEAAEGTAAFAKPRACWISAFWEGKPYAASASATLPVSSEGRTKRAGLSAQG